MAIGTTEIQDIVATDSINRAAFPAYKVFIYGHDVSDDVMSVRVNQSGGSVERSPMTCAITLQNQMDKYIFNHYDMIRIGITKSKLDDSWESFGKTWYDVQSVGNEWYNPYSMSLPEVNEDGTVRIEGSDQIVYPLGGSSVTISSQVIREFAPKLAVASAEERVYLLKAYLGSQGDYEITEVDANALTSAMIQSLDSLDNNTVKDLDISDSYNVESLGYNIKQQIVNKKLTYTASLKPQNKDSSLLNYEDKVLYDYPMQEGDCIFHANDPVRVAFRDPFDPRVWYWSFAGFIDTWTEDVGVNFDSQITLTCTDVSKMVRYAVVQLKTGLLDPNLDVFLQGLTTQGGQTAANTDLILTKELFEDLSLIEILEVIFFGSQSAIELVDGRAFSIVNQLTDLTENELRDYFISRFNLTLEQAREYVPYGLNNSDPDAFDPSYLDDVNINTDDAWVKIKNKVLDFYTSKSVARFNALNWQGIVNSRNVGFKRSEGVSGVHYYVYGTPSETDKYFGATAITDLHDWNETIHHRVRRDDLSSMRVSSYAGNPSNLTIDQVIYTIGTDIEGYPVGGGRVFFMGPAKMDTVIGDGVLDHAFGGVGSMHSVFKDRLSYIYDLAEVVDFRFYATTKGDLVFEMPFYDFNPQAFWKTKQLNEGGVTKDVNPNVLDFNYDSVFQQSYTGDYTSSELDDLTTLNFERNTTNLDLIDYDKPPQFDYGRNFTIDVHEQSGFSNTMSDKGMITAYRVKANYVAGWAELNNSDAQKYQWAIDKSLIPTLGVRVDEGNMWGFVEGKSAAELYAGLELNKINAEARNVGVETIPKFGLMVNRPVHWKYRNYYANIVSLSHSVVWNSDVNTSINVNQIRGWAGEVDSDTGIPIFRHFGDTDRPFNLVELLSRAQASNKKNKKAGADQKVQANPNEGRIS